MKTGMKCWSYLAEFYLAWEMLQEKSCRENQNTHFMVTNIFFLENRAAFMR